jgi:N-acetylneuraminic acid mutarotase
LGSVAIDGIVYAIGGANTGGASPLARLDAYNPSTNEWKPRAAMNKARFYLAAAALDGQIYAIGGAGEIDTSGTMGALANVESYDPSTDSWSVKASMITPRSNLAAAALNGRIYAIGGHQPNINPAALDVVEAYDPVANTWSPKKSLPDPGFALVAVASGGHIYVLGAGTKVLEYDPVADTWTEKAQIQTPRSGAGAAAAYGKIYLIGGAGGGSSESDIVEAYDPLQNSWSTQLKKMPTGRRELACAFANGHIHAIGGATGVANTVQAAVELYAP